SSDDGYWRRAVPIRILDAETLALGPSDALLHAIVHGMRWNAEPTIRWVADAMAILQASGRDINWGGLVREAARQQVVLRLCVGLEYLRRSMGAPIPHHAIERLRAARPGMLEHLETRVLALDADAGGTLRPGHALLVAVQYLRFMSGKGPLEALAE